MTAQRRGGGVAAGGARLYDPGMRSTQDRLIALVGYGQYIFMAVLAMAGMIGMVIRASSTAGPGAPRHGLALGFAALFAVVGGYSLWRLRRLVLHQRRIHSAGEP